MAIHFLSCSRLLTVLRCFLAGFLLISGASAVDLTQPGFSVKLTTTNGGLYAVKASVVAALVGQPEATVQAWFANGLVSLSNLGRPVGFLPEADGSQFYFYAEAAHNNYTDKNYYWLRSGVNSPPTSLDGQAPAPASGGSYPATLYHEVNADPYPSLTADPEQDYWEESRLIGTPGIASYTAVDFTTDQVDLGSPASVIVGVRLFGNAPVPQLARVYVKNTSPVRIGDVTWVGRVPYATNLPAALPLLANGGTTTVYVQASGDQPPTYTYSDWYFNSVSLTWPRKYVSDGGKLDCTANTNPVVTISGFTNSSIRVVDVTDVLHPVWVGNTAIVGAASPFQISFKPQNPAAGHHVAFVTAAAPSVSAAILINDSPMLQPASPVQCLYLAPSAFISTAAPLVAYRQGQGLTTAVLPVESVFDQYGFGVPSPASVQSFLKAAAAAWGSQLRYVTFLGNGNYDYRNLKNYNSNFIPPMMVPTDFGLVPADAPYGDTTGDGLMDLAVGRLPATSTAQLAAMITKIIAYEANTPSPSPKILGLADWPDPSAGDFPADVTNVFNAVSPKFSNQFVQGMLATNLATVRATLFSDLNGGEDVMVYLGHGSVDRLGTQGYLVTADAATPANSARMPVIIAASCVVGDFGIPGTVSFAGNWVLQSTGGAIAAIAASGLSYNYDASRLTTDIAALLGDNSRPRLGDIYRVGFNRHLIVDQPYSTPWQYNLIGDAALRVSVPANSPSTWQPPSVALFAPTNAPVRSPGVLAMQATASDPDGVVDRVVLFQDGVQVAQASGFTFVLGVTNPPPGVHQYWAVAYDDTGLSATSAVQMVTVAVPVGNLIWLDNGAGGGVGNDGIKDVNEAGIDGVVVALWNAGANGSIGGGDDSMVATTASANGGRYGFGVSLAAGNYYVVITNPPAIYTSASATVLPGDNRNKGVQAAPGAAVFGPVFSLDATSANNTMDFGFYQPGATLGTVVAFEGFWETNQTVVRWTTVNEFWTLGYDLYRQDTGGALTRVNPAMVPTNGALFGGDYSLNDVAAEPRGLRHYLLAEVALTGTNWFGPIEVKVPDAAVVTSSRISPSGFEAGFLGLPGLEYRIEVSSDLDPADWVQVGATVADAEGHFSFLDSGASALPKRFYRAFWP